MVQPAQADIPWYAKVGSLRPLCRGAAGRLLLSPKSDVEVQQLVWRTNAEESNAALRVDIHEVLKDLDTIRHQGHALSAGAANPLAGVIAVELPVPADKPPLALGLGGPVAYLQADLQRLVELPRTAVAPYRDLHRVPGAA